MTEIEFRALGAQGYNRIPLLAECLADLDTPLSLYVKLIDRSLDLRTNSRASTMHRPNEFVDVRTWRSCLWRRRT